MMAESLRRKLTTILSADVAGYSRLMDIDEVGTFERLIAYRTAMAGFIDRHRGRVVNTAGDGLLAEFDSVVEAVQCAVEIQRELDARNADLDEEHRMRFRIGINLGDVMVEGADLYGEGVNIAARLQGLAEPGGVCISGTAYDQVHNKLSVGYLFIGEQSVKNIAEQVPVYRLVLDGRSGSSGAGDGGPAVVAGGDGRGDSPQPRPIGNPRAAHLVYLLFVLSLVFGVGGLVLAAVTGDHPFAEPGGEIVGDAAFTEDSAFNGKISGNVVVAPGVTFDLDGKIEGNLTLGPRSLAKIDGKIEGDVINHGGTLRLRGKLEGSERSVAPDAYAGPPAKHGQASPPQGEPWNPSAESDSVTDGAAPVMAAFCLLSILAGVVAAYANRGDGTDWVDTHFRFQIRTFWIGLLVFGAGAWLTMAVIGVAVLLVLPIWLTIRCLRGWRFLARGEPHPNPASWLIG